LTEIRGGAAHGAGKPLELTGIDVGPLGAGEVEIKVEHCGPFHSDLSAWNNVWACPSTRSSSGTRGGAVTAVGEPTMGVKVSDRVGAAETRRTVCTAISA
jgi:uncharacterized zinc-type alcohol dehydrogenase-like protein